MFAVVMGLLAAVLVPVSSQIRGSMPGLSGAQLTAASVARTAVSAPRVRPTPTPPPAPADSCALIVPEDPLSARGLATPWQLTGNGAGACHEANSAQSAFVEGAVLDPATGKVSVYDPLVIDRGSRPAIEPTRPTLPAGAVVGLWLGFNAANLTLRGPGAASCVNGVEGTIFGQNAFCNATAFFQAANDAIQSKKLVPPALGTAKDGKPCPTTRDFSVVDQDQSDNTTTVYLQTKRGQMAQNTPANAARLGGATAAKNGSDEGLLDRAVDAALGCTPWTAPDLADKTGKQLSTSWPLNELMAAARQAAPIALVPEGDPFVQGANGPSLSKLNAYRAGVDQPMVSSVTQASTRTYCQNLLRTGLPRIAADQKLTQQVASPAPDTATNLFTFLATRFSQAISNDDGFLHCLQLLNVQNPITLQTNADGVTTGATIDLRIRPAKR